MLYPWHDKQWQQLQSAYAENRLPHGLLLTGIKGLGKAEFADHFLQALLCQETAKTKTLSVCGDCHSCRLVVGRVHPNALWVMPEKEGQAIKVDQIRAISEFVGQSSLQGTYRVVVINDAHRLNMSAANALLKTLEEPATGAVLVLVAERSLSMPATIVSRCQRILFAPPPLEKAVSWLQSMLNDEQQNARILLRFVQNAPLAALTAAKAKFLELRNDLYQALTQLAEGKGDPLKFAFKLQQADGLQLLDLYLLWVMDLMQLQVGMHEEGLVNQDYLATYKRLQNKKTLREQQALLDKIAQLRKTWFMGNNLNKQLLLESLFFQWMQLFNQA